MTRIATRCFALALFVLLPVLAQPALAHDDGLTCHSHPTFNGGEGFDFVQVNGANGPGPGIDSLAHRLDNQLDAQPGRYDAADVTAVRRGLAELREMTQAVRLLVLRSERLPNPVEARAALAVAETAFDGLPIRDFIGFDSFLAEYRNREAVVVPLDALVAYLRTVAGVSADLAAEVESAAESC